MNVMEVATRPIPGQRPGTSGLRKKVSVFQAKDYVENYVQSLFDTLPERSGKTLILGGDGRYFNAETIQTILRMAAANDIGRVVVGKNGILSTPAASVLIRKRSACGGIILSASHNMGGKDGDFGIKFNAANGGPASEAIGEAIFRRTGEIKAYRTVAAADVPLDRVQTISLGGMTIEVIDPVADYVSVMSELFDFDAIRQLLAGDYQLVIDTLNAVGGPYAKVIFCDILGVSEKAVVNAVPLPDFGGLHPDPNPVHAATLMSLMNSAAAPDFGAATDGDGDRNMIVGRGFPVSPSDSIAILAANATLVPGYKAGLAGVARSMPTSRALDQVSTALSIRCFEVPTGWKFFGNLMDAGLIDLCGEESYGTGSSHIREKDGIWAILFWLNLIAVRKQGVEDIVRAHWRQYGRHYYSRHDYEGLDATIAADLMNDLRSRLPALIGTSYAGRTVTMADDFGYVDPVDGSLTEKQGVRIIFGDAARVIFRLSGTGTEGATVRVYFEQFEPSPQHHDVPPQQMLSELIAFAERMAGIATRTGRTAPDVIT